VTVQSGTPLKEVQARFLAYHRAKKHAEGTIRHYAETFADLDRWIAATNRPRIVGVLTSGNLEAFATWLDETPLRITWRGSRKRTLQGLHGRMKDLRAFVSWCIGERYLPPGTKVILPKLPEASFTVLTNEQLVAVFCCKYLTAAGAQGVRNRALVGVLLDTGMRLAELATLTLDRLFLEERMILVIGKGTKRRHVFFNAGTADELAHWLRVRPAEFATLFGLTRDGIRMLLKRLQRETGIHLHAHLFRHQAATMMARQGMGELDLKRILGHAKLETVEIYVNMTTEDLRSKHEATSPMDTVRGLLPGSQPTRPARRRLRLVG
jgi:site-specific recombinase XerD